MSSPEDAPKQYPVACPSCSANTGYPYQVRTLHNHPGAIEVKLRCRECGHEWVMVVTSR